MSIDKKLKTLTIIKTLTYPKMAARITACLMNDSANKATNDSKQQHTTNTAQNDANIKDRDNNANHKEVSQDNRSVNHNEINRSQLGNASFTGA